MSEPADPMVHKTIDNCYYIIKSLTSQNDWYVGFDLKTGKYVLVKQETVEESESLKIETKLLKKLGEFIGIPKLVYTGSENLNGTETHLLITEMLGPSLEELFYFWNKSFSTKTWALLFIQMLGLIQDVHSADIIHRNLSPESFQLGLSDESNRLYISGFSQSRYYRETFSKKHIPYDEEQTIAVWNVYSSINVLSGIEYSRRDDLLSIGYIIIYFMKPSHQIFKAVEKKSHENVNTMYEQKISVPLGNLWDKLPVQIIKYMDYLSLLNFDEDPDYTYLKNLWGEILVECGQKGVVQSEWFDWFDPIKKEMFCYGNKYQLIWYEKDHNAELTIRQNLETENEIYEVSED